MDKETIFFIVAIIVLMIFAVGFGIATLILQRKYLGILGELEQLKEANIQPLTRINSARVVRFEEYMVTPIDIYAEVIIPRTLEGISIKEIHNQLKKEIFSQIDISAFHIQRDVSMPSFDTIYKARLQIINNPERGD